MTLRGPLSWDLQVWAIQSIPDGSYLAHRAVTIYQGNRIVTMCNSEPRPYLARAWNADGLEGVARKEPWLHRLSPCKACEAAFVKTCPSTS